MFDVAPSELLLVAVVALVVIGPKDLPRAMRVVGRWLGKARTLSRHFRSGIDEMIRQSEMEEMEKRWAEENAKLLAENQGQGDHAPSASVTSPISDDPAEQNIVFSSPADLEINPAESTPPAASHATDTASSIPAKPKEADPQEKQS